MDIELISGQKLLRLIALFQLESIRKGKDNSRLLFGITLHDISNIYLYKVAWACPTLRIGVGYATHILIRYVFLLTTIIERTTEINKGKYQDATVTGSCSNNVKVDS